MTGKGIAPTLVVLALAAGPASARADDASQVRRAVSATVRILTGSFGPEGQFRGQTSGSGVIISADGRVLAAAGAAATPSAPQAAGSLVWAVTLKHE